MRLSQPRHSTILQSHFKSRGNMTCASENINNNNNNNNRTIDMAQWHGLRSTKGLCTCCWPYKIRYNIMLTWYFQTISLWWTSARIVRLSHILEMEFNGSDWPGTQCEWEAALTLLFVLSIEICVEADISVYLNSLCCPFGADTKQSVLEERENAPDVRKAFGDLLLSFILSLHNVDLLYPT